MAGLVPAISLRKARLCPPYRDRRDEPGDDDGEGGELIETRVSVIPVFGNVCRSSVDPPRPALPSTSTTDCGRRRPHLHIGIFGHRRLTSGPSGGRSRPPP